MYRLIAPLLLLAAAAPAKAPSLTPGLWAVHSAPGTATLDGRALGDLPYTPPAGPEQVCLTAEQARTAARWFARDIAADCTFAKSTTAGGRIDVAGACPAATAGQPAGSFSLRGKWSATKYTLTFATESSGENGRMGFTGTVSAERIGACPG